MKRNPIFRTNRYLTKLKTSSFLRPNPPPLSPPSLSNCLDETSRSVLGISLMVCWGVSSRGKKVRGGGRDLKVASSANCFFKTKAKNKCSKMCMSSNTESICELFKLKAKVLRHFKDDLVLKMYRTCIFARYNKTFKLLLGKQVCLCQSINSFSLLYWY